MNCKHCGTEISDGSRFCNYCGKSINDDKVSDLITFKQFKQYAINAASDLVAWGIFKTKSPVNFFIVLTLIGMITTPIGGLGFIVTVLLTHFYYNFKNLVLKKVELLKSKTKVTKIEVEKEDEK